MAQETSEKRRMPAGAITPAWINQENFSELLQKQVVGFKKILSFDTGLCGGAGENYCSIMLRIKATVELAGGSTKDVSYMIKTLPQSPEAGAIVNMMGFFPKEVIMYAKHIPEFEHMYKIAGKPITFGPKSYILANDPGVEYVLLEDLGRLGFKNQNRLQGLDKEHTEAALKMLAQFHAASAVRLETKGEYDISFMQSSFKESSRDIFASKIKHRQTTYLECLRMSEIGSRYVDKVLKYQSSEVDNLIIYNKPILSDFNVINHGDFWLNNIMFRHSENGKLEETILVDFQVSKYGSPAIDLFYFLVSSIELELKTKQFNELIKYYHDHLVENLKLLQYSKEIPTLKQLHMDLLKYNYWAIFTMTSVMPMILLDPNEDASLDSISKVGGDGRKFMEQMYLSPRHVKHLETILPYFDLMGFLDM